MPLTEKNHFVPQLYLKHFASERGLLYRYRLLVSKSTIAPWKKSHVAGTGYQRHLYTRHVDGREIDDIETWLSRDFETPAVAPLQKVVNNERLSKSDYIVLSRFVAAQIVRTPAFLTCNLPRWLREAEQEMKEAPARILRRLEEAKKSGIRLQSSHLPETEYFPLKVREVPSDDPGKRSFETKMVVGRGYWHFAMKHMLTSTLDRLAEHRWTILEAPEGLPWFTSDDPVIRLNYHNENEYDFGGGWGSEGTEILLPVSPSHMLYTQIGRKQPQRGTVVTLEQASLLRKIIAEHAHRMIYSPEPEVSIEQLRPRVVSESSVNHEQQEWEKWHREQSDAERALADPEVAF